MFSLLHQYPVLLLILVWALAQGLKEIIHLILPSWNKWRGVTTSGMPSVHSAFVTSLATIVAWDAGLGSVAFAIAFCLACIVLYDAMNVRLESGRHAHRLNQMAATSDARFRESLGHTFWQVVAGTFLGVGLTLLFLIF